MTDTRFTRGAPEPSDNPAPEEKERRELLARLQVPETAEAEIDELYDALASSRRRAVATYVDEHGRATLTELAEHVAESESPDRPGIKSVELSLHHADVPRLVDADLLTYGEDRHHIRRGTRLTAAAPK